MVREMDLLPELFRSLANYRNTSEKALEQENTGPQNGIVLRWSAAPLGTSCVFLLALGQSFHR